MSKQQQQQQQLVNCLGDALAGMGFVLLEATEMSAQPAQSGAFAAVHARVLRMCQDAQPAEHYQLQVQAHQYVHIVCIAGDMPPVELLQLEQQVEQLLEERAGQVEQEFAD